VDTTISAVSQQYTGESLPSTQIALETSGELATPENIDSQITNIPVSEGEVNIAGASNNESATVVGGMALPEAPIYQQSEEPSIIQFSSPVLEQTPLVSADATIAVCPPDVSLPAVPPPTDTINDLQTSSEIKNNDVIDAIGEVLPPTTEITAEVPYSATQEKEEVSFGEVSLPVLDTSCEFPDPNLEICGEIPNNVVETTENVPFPNASLPSVCDEVVQPAMEIADEFVKTEDAVPFSDTTFDQSTTASLADAQANDLPESVITGDSVSYDKTVDLIDQSDLPDPVDLPPPPFEDMPADTVCPEPSIDMPCIEPPINLQGTEIQPTSDETEIPELPPMPDQNNEVAADKKTEKNDIPVLEDVVEHSKEQREQWWNEGNKEATESDLSLTLSAPEPIATVCEPPTDEPFSSQVIAANDYVETQQDSSFQVIEPADNNTVDEALHDILSIPDNADLPPPPSDVIQQVNGETATSPPDFSPTDDKSLPSPDSPPETDMAENRKDNATGLEATVSAQA
jgi:hypothetical protein